MAQPRRDKPQYAIAPVLEALGADSVPRVRGSGHARLLCPFHPDTNPSASVSQYGFTCWGCGRTGDAIKLIREEWNLSYADAVEKCEEFCGSGDSALSQPSRGSRSLLDI